MAQARGVGEALTRSTGRPVELVPVTTEGDRSDAPVERLGVGVFVSALRDALAAKEIDLAVHSYKDLPTAPVDGLVVAAVPARTDPGDALVARDRLPLAHLPRRAHRPDLVVVGLRGNGDTRLRKVAAGELDAVVVACAGLVRLGRTDEITERLDPAVMLPAPAQGALAVECRDDDGDTVDAVAVLDHPDSRVAVAAERQLLATLEAGCSAPVAGLAEVRYGPRGRVVTLHGAVISPDGSRTLRRSRTAPVPDGPQTVAAAAQLGRDLAVDLFTAGARTILENDT